MLKFDLYVWYIHISSARNVWIKFSLINNNFGLQLSLLSSSFMVPLVEILEVMISGTGLFPNSDNPNTCLSYYPASLSLSVIVLFVEAVLEKYRFPVHVQRSQFRVQSMNNSPCSFMNRRFPTPFLLLLQKEKLTILIVFLQKRYCDI